MMTPRHKTARLLATGATVLLASSMGIASGSAAGDPMTSARQATTTQTATADRELPQPSMSPDACEVSVHADKKERPPYYVWGNGYVSGCERGHLTVSLYKSDGDGFPEYLGGQSMDCTYGDCSLGTGTYTYTGGNYCAKVTYEPFEGSDWDCLYG